MYSKYSNIDEWYKDNPDPRKSEEQAAIKYFKQLKVKNDETRKMKYFNEIVDSISKKDIVVVIGDEYFTNFDIDFETKTITASGLDICLYRDDVSASIYPRQRKFDEYNLGLLTKVTITKDELKSVVSTAYERIKKFI